MVPCIPSTIANTMVLTCFGTERAASTLLALAVSGHTAPTMLNIAPAEGGPPGATLRAERPGQTPLPTGHLDSPRPTPSLCTNPTAPSTTFLALVQVIAKTPRSMPFPTTSRTATVTRLQSRELLLPIPWAAP